MMLAQGASASIGEVTGGVGWKVGAAEPSVPEVPGVAGGMEGAEGGTKVPSSEV